MTRGICDFVAQIRPGDNRQHRIYDMQTGMQHLLPFDHTASAITVGNDAYAAAAKNFEKETWVEIRDGFYRQVHPFAA